MWDSQLAAVGSQLLHGRLRLLARPPAAPQRGLRRDQRRTLIGPGRLPLQPARRGRGRWLGTRSPTSTCCEKELLATLAEVRDQEVERGVCLVGPHRDDLHLTLGELPAKGYASHGESWSFALGLKLAAYQLLRSDLGEDPVLVLDDVFAELDTGRRERLAELVEDCEQVLITAAVGADVPEVLRERGTTYAVSLGEVTRVA